MVTINPRALFYLLLPSKVKYANAHPQLLPLSRTQYTHDDPANKANPPHPGKPTINPWQLKSSVKY